MVDPDTGDASPRYHVVRTDYKHYELWIADRIAIFNNRADLDRWVELLKTQAVPYRE